MSYGITFEVEGRYALFCRPELKVERVSYDVITPSAARGILEAVCWEPAIRYFIDEIVVCNQIKYENIRRNEINSKIPYRQTQTALNDYLNGSLYLAAGNDRTQRAARVLKDVRYLITAHFEMTSKAGVRDNEAKFVDMIKRRLRDGKNYHTPYLGTREYPASVRLVDDGDERPSPIDITKDLGLMLYDIDYIKETDDEGFDWVLEYVPLFFQAHLKQGVINLRNVEVLR